MKKILLALFLLTGIVSAEINEYLSDVYFANGIDTTKEQAYHAKDKLSEKFKLSNPQSYKSVANWKVSYNTTHGIAIELYESMLQKIYEDEVGQSFVPFIWNWDEFILVCIIKNHSNPNHQKRSISNNPSTPSESLALEYLQCDASSMSLGYTTWEGGTNL